MIRLFNTRQIKTMSLLKIFNQIKLILNENEKLKQEE